MERLGILFVLYFFVSLVSHAENLKGLDVSHYQGRINWKKVAENNISFAYVKASEGSSIKDKKYTRNIKAARQSGIRVGPYHYFSLCVGGKEQAENFIMAAQKFPNMLPPVVDIEYAGNCPQRPSVTELEKEALLFSAEVKNAFNQEPIIYTKIDFYSHYLQSAKFSNYRYWVPVDAQINAKVVIRQTDTNGSVPGIKTSVDLDVAEAPFY
jgi:lysozyme